MDDTEYITIKTAAIKLHCHPETLRRAKRSGLLETRKAGKKLLTTWAWIQAYLTKK